MPDVSGGPAIREARSRANRGLGTGGHDASPDGVSCAVKALFCDRHHIAGVFLSPPSHREHNVRASLPPVDRTAYAVLTFDVPPKPSAPLTRGFFCAKLGNGQTYVQAAISRECNAAH